MDKEGYLLLQDDKYVFTFVSVGKNGKIIKAIIFQNIEPMVFNLVLADYNPISHLFDDFSVSNNNDISKVMATVFKAIVFFLNSQPQASIYVEGNTQQKNILYNRIFKNYYSIISAKYNVKGQNEFDVEEYIVGKNYKSF